MSKAAIWISACVLALGCTADPSGDDANGSAAMGASGGGAGAGGAAGAMGAGSGGAGGTAGVGAGAGGGGTGGTCGSAPCGAGTGGMSDGGSAGEAPMPDAAVEPEPDASVDPGERAGWRITFREEFDGAEGTGIDTSKWTPQNKGDGFGNNELQFYTPRTENARMDGDGSLIIETRKESYMGRDFTSARLETKGKFEQTFGRFEIRAKLPFGQGIWPAFWMLGNDISEVSWPQCGEIDIMEHVGRTPSTNYGSLHGPGYSGGNPLSAQYQLEDGERFADDFHEYAVEWEQDVVRFYVDGELYETRTPSDVPGGGQWVYDHPFFLILNVAVGGAFPGSPDETTTFPQRMLVDYVRVYEREP